MNSPLFPQEALSATTPPFVLPDKPNASSGLVALYVILAEANLFVKGFTPLEWEGRPPAILRGLVFLRVTKPVKAKALTLTFRGLMETDWPEGIPPKKNEFQEARDLVSHTWPFYSAGDLLPNNGADMYFPPNEDMPEVALDSVLLQDLRPMLLPMPSNLGAKILGTLSPGSRSRSLSLPKPELVPQQLSLSKGDFPPGDYVYNFEHPVPQSSAETVLAHFGRVHYWLETKFERTGMLKTLLDVRVPVAVVRQPLDESVEELEPIHVTKEWEDQLSYDVIIASKTVILNTFLPVALRFQPRDKHMRLLRIRFYLTENIEYYCRDKKVHRAEPTKRYLLLEFKLEHKGRSLLADQTQPYVENADEAVMEQEMEFQVYVPEHLGRWTRLHPKTAFETIQAHHWLKVCLRLSRLDTEDPTKRKHFEITIEAPVTVLDRRCSHANTLLPSYTALIDPPAGMVASGVQPSHVISPLATPLLSPGVTAVEDSWQSQLLDPHHRVALPMLSPSPSVPNLHLGANLFMPEDIPLELTLPQAQPALLPMTLPALRPLLPALRSGTAGVVRPIHLLRRPSDDNPPAFSERPAALDIGMGMGIDGLLEPPLVPPTYEEVVGDRRRKSPASTLSSSLRLERSSQETHRSSHLSVPQVQLQHSREETPEPSGIAVPIPIRPVLPAAQLAFQNQLSQNQQLPLLASFGGSAPDGFLAPSVHLLRRGSVASAQLLLVSLDMVQPLLHTQTQMLTSFPHQSIAGLMGDLSVDLTGPALAYHPGHPTWRRESVHARAHREVTPPSTDVADMGKMPSGSESSSRQEIV